MCLILVQAYFANCNMLGITGCRDSGCELRDSSSLHQIDDICGLSMEFIFSCGFYFITKSPDSKWKSPSWVQLIVSSEHQGLVKMGRYYYIKYLTSWAKKRSMLAVDWNSANITYLPFSYSVTNSSSNT